MSKLRESLKRQEDLKLKPYLCTARKLTIGFGRNLQDRGISLAEAEMLLDNDIRRVRMEASMFPWFEGVDQVRQDVILNMLFQLGLTRFLGFKRMLEALSAGDFETASREMLDSLWAKQTPKRAQELAKMMRGGSYPPT